ncbi:UNVERIFIED_CONTAM: hypothetical protein GTU68_007328, partial [Idotea baltica]|nr:hypothetical protein [Idotea baltica]
VVSGSYVEALKEEECQTALGLSNPPKKRLQESSISEFYTKNLSDYLDKEGVKGEKVLFCLGVSCLQLFTQNNFCGPLIGPPAFILLPGLVPCKGNENDIREEAQQELVLDAEGIYSLLSEPEYLIVAKIVFCDLRERLSSCISVDWWCCRYGIIHQKVVDEQSPMLYKILVECFNRTESNSDLINENSRDIGTLFHLEAGHFHLHYYDVRKAKHHFDRASSILAMEIHLTGALGMRTKWQQQELAQLVVKVSYVDHPITQDEQPGPTLLPSDLPKDIILNDDARLHRIKFIEMDEDVIPNLRPLEQMAVFAHLILKRKSQAQDDTFNEETKAFLMAILQYPKNWALQMSALVIRSKVESGEMRAMERSLNQFEELVSSVHREEPSRYERLKLIHSSFLLSQWNLHQELARMFMRLGCTKTALELFEKLHLWEDVILCYNELQMRQRSAEIIQELLDKEESPKLWCLMGDATDDIECYNKAWELSGLRSGRAQRCLGNYYYVRKDYTKAIEHYEISVQLNTLQFPVWQKLAYCALQTECWEKCASAYKRCSILEPDNFECWNNMSQAYLKLGETHKAWKSLEEALRCRMDNWRLWDNYMLVSTSLGYMSQALNAYNRILQYKEKHIDTEILGRIVQAVLNEKVDPEGREMKTLHRKCLELVGKLTREVPTHAEIWFLYAELSYASPERCQEKRHTAMQHYRKSVAAETQKSGWDKNTDTVILVLMRALRLIQVAKEVSKESDAKAGLADLSSIRMLLKSIVTQVNQNQVNVNTGEIVEAIKTPLSEVQEEILHINILIETLRAT